MVISNDCSRMRVHWLFRNHRCKPIVRKHSERCQTLGLCGPLPVRLILLQQRASKWSSRMECGRNLCKLGTFPVSPLKIFNVNRMTAMMASESNTHVCTLLRNSSLAMIQKQNSGLTIRVVTLDTGLINLAYRTSRLRPHLHSSSLAWTSRRHPPYFVPAEHKSHRQHPSCLPAGEPVRTRRSPPRTSKPPPAIFELLIVAGDRREVLPKRPLEQLHRGSSVGGVSPTNLLDRTSQLRSFEQVRQVLVALLCLIEYRLSSNLAIGSHPSKYPLAVGRRIFSNECLRGTAQ